MSRHLAALVVVAALSASLVLGYAHPFGNPRAERSGDPRGLLQQSGLPPQARDVLVSKCADCHSSATRWPIYSRLAPGSWLIERDVAQARSHLNLSHWQDLSPDQRDVLLSEIVQQTRSAKMPPLQYRLLHWTAGLSESDRQALALLRSGVQPLETAGPQPGDPVHGRLVFEKRCTGCHAMEANREGPRLAGVFGRPAGTAAGFTYTAGMKQARLTWNSSTLDRWLADPDSMIPDNSMGVGVPKAIDRRDLIAYLQQQGK